MPDVLRVAGPFSAHALVYALLLDPAGGLAVSRGGGYFFRRGGQLGLRTGRSAAPRRAAPAREFLGSGRRYRPGKAASSMGSAARLIPHN